MKQPPGFIVKGKERLVCRLRRSIYGLKQSARCWNQRLHAVLQQLGFKQSESDHCLYTKVVGGLQVFLLVYVDDILVACRSSAEIDKITRALKREFDITDLGEPSYFLGLEIQRHTSHRTALVWRDTLIKSLKCMDFKLPRPLRVQWTLDLFRQRIAVHHSPTIWRIGVSLAPYCT